MNGRMDGQTDGRKISPFHKTLSPLPKKGPKETRQVETETGEIERLIEARQKLTTKFKTNGK